MHLQNDVLGVGAVPSSLPALTGDTLKLEFSGGTFEVFAGALDDLEIERRVFGLASLHKFI